MHHEDGGLEVAAERAFLRRLEGGCQVPVAAYARRSDAGTTMRLHGRVISLGGEATAEGYESGTVLDEVTAAELGTRLAERLLREGAGSILSEVRSAAVPPSPSPDDGAGGGDGLRWHLSGTRCRAEEPARLVEERPLMTFRAPPDWSPLDLALERLSSYRAVAITSPRAATALTDRLALRGMSVWPRQNPPRLWAGGTATAAALGNVLGPVRVPAEGTSGEAGAAAALARAMLDAGVAGPVLFPCGDTRRDELPDRLRQAAIAVDEVVCYRSVLANESVARDAGARGTVLVVASPTVAELLVRACPPDRDPA